MGINKATSSRELRYFVAGLKIEKRADGDESRVISGHAAVYDKWSNPIWGWFIEKINRGAFDDADFSNCIFCFNHNSSTIMARTASGTLTLEIDEKGLKFSFEAPNTTNGNDLLELVRRGDITECSFSFVCESDVWTYADKDNGLEYDQREILKISHVFDVSAVVYPAYNDTSIDVRSLEERKQEYLKMKNENPLQAKLESEARDRICQQMALLNK